MKLGELLYGRGTEFDSNKRCLPQTRLSFLDAIVQWINDPDPSSPKVLALLGQSGTGKSSIAHEIAHRYSRINRLTTSYRFVRGNPSGPYRFFTTLARDLCRTCPAFKYALGRILNKGPRLADVRNYTTLVELLLRDPVKDLCFVGPIVIVIDALDENEDAFRKPLYADGNSIPFHTALLQWVSELPSNFRILITSRPEVDLLDAFPKSLPVHYMHMDDQRFAKEVDKDIRIFMDTQLDGAMVGEGDLQKLAKKAQGLLQWAFVVCNYIVHPPCGLNSKLCIQQVLNLPTTIKRAPKPLDARYTTVLEGSNMKDSEVCDGLNNLGSPLIHVTPSESALPLALHTPFLTNGTRSGDFYVNLNNIHVGFALATLRTLQAELQFNICKLETFYLLNSEVSDLKKRVADNISSALSYSCRFWADHLARVSEFNSDVFGSLLVFMKERFLFWLEVLSVRGEMGIAKPALLSLEGWLNQMHNKVSILNMFISY